jgi:hypothetical protein
VVTSISGVIYGWAVATGSVTGTDSLTLTTDTDNGVGADTAAPQRFLRPLIASE